MLHKKRVKNLEEWNSFAVDQETNFESKIIPVSVIELSLLGLTDWHSGLDIYYRWGKN